jgi:phosphate transport system substrate-binding protein
MRLRAIGLLAPLIAAGCGTRPETYHATGEPFAVKMAVLAAGDFSARKITIELDGDCAVDDDVADRLCGGTLDFVGADDPTSFASAGACLDSTSPAPHLVGYDAVAMIVPAANGWTSSLRTSELERIFWSSGRGLRWSDLRPEWPSDEIALVGTSCTEASCRVLDTWIPRHRLTRGMREMPTVDKTVEQVATSPGSVGWIPVVALAGAGRGVRAVPIEGESGDLSEPTTKQVQAGTYPLTVPLFLLTPPPNGSSPRLDEFVRHIVRHRARLAPLVGLVPVETGDQVAAAAD